MKDQLILGLDIGGANTKAALILFEKNQMKKSFSYIEYFPFWEKNLNDIPKMFNRIIKNLINRNQFNLLDIDFITVTITAELSDAFQTKKEGIFTILDALECVFQKEKMFFISIDNEFLTFNEAKKEYFKIEAANWVSTALFLGYFEPQCILIDAGSNTIDIIPILNSIPVTKGKDDVSRLLNHELIYTGGLRATIPSITHFVPYKGEMIRISFEKFALIADVHRILNNISEQQYINDTADNRSKSMEDCYARLARIICGDIDTISYDDLQRIAIFIYQKQLEIISDELKLFIENFKKSYKKFNNNFKFVITGLSAEFLIRNVLKLVGYENIKIYEEITHIPDSISSSAYAIAGAFYYKLKGMVGK